MIMLKKLEEKLTSRMDERMGPLAKILDKVLAEQKMTNEILRKTNRDLNESMGRLQDAIQR